MKLNLKILAYKRIETNLSHLIWCSNNSISCTGNSGPEISTFLSNWACYSRTCTTQENKMKDSLNAKTTPPKLHFHGYKTSTKIYNKSVAAQAHH